MEDAVTRILKDLGSCEGYHNSMVQKWESRYKSYRGFLSHKAEAAKWNSRLHPPYVFQIIETIVGNMIDDQTSFAVSARPHISDPADIAQRREAAKSLEYLLKYCQDIDHFDEKQRPFALQQSITGLTVGKVYWDYSVGPVTRKRTTHTPIIHPYTGEAIGHIPTTTASEQIEVIRDDPTFEVVDVRDFMWHEAATDIQRAKFAIHRVWMTYEELEELQAAGVYSNIAELKESRDFSMTLSYREGDLFNRNRTKDLIEVLEYWTNDEVVTVGNRKTLLRQQNTPFWHKQKPFVTCSSMPDLFSIPGISDVELVEELQQMLWTVMNQRLDNLSLINNAIILMRGDIEDYDAYEFAPGERWMVDDPEQVTMWTPTTIPAEVSLSAEQQIKGDLQDITGGMPFVSGADQSSVDNKTATGVSIVTSLAQRRLEAKKQNFRQAYRRVAEMKVALLQQFMDKPKVIQIVGRDAETDFITVNPEDVQGKWNVSVDAVSDSLLRQERRAEGQAMLQLAAQVAPVMAAVNQPFNMQAFAEDWLRSYGIDDAEKYFSATPQQIPAPGQQQPSQSGAPGQPSMGVTAPQSIAPEVSPSNQASMAPSVFLQRAMAMNGGVDNTQR